MTDIEKCSKCGGPIPSGTGRCVACRKPARIGGLGGKPAGKAVKVMIILGTLLLLLAIYEMAGYLAGSGGLLLPGRARKLDPVEQRIRSLLDSAPAVTAQEKVPASSPEPKAKDDSADSEKGSDK
jgi:hypothetical protein